MNAFKIESGIPLPLRSRGQQIVDALRKMKVGDSVKLTGITDLRDLNAWYVAAKRQHFRITVKRIGSSTYRIWKVKDNSERGGS